jgi:GDP-L-fucose synthase
MLSKRILVTGGHGFLGKHVCQKLWERGYSDVIVPSHERYDLTNQTDVDGMFSIEGPEIVIHLAANVGGIGANQTSPADFLYDNAVMGLEIMRAAKDFDIEKLVTVGTVCSYPKMTSVPFKEEDIHNGYPEETNAPYGLAKKLLLTYSQALRQQYLFNSIYLIPTNLYGPGDNFDSETSHVIPALIKKIDFAVKNNEKFVDMWGSGLTTRDFLYVEDCAEAIVKAMEIYNEPDPINLGSGEEISIFGIAERIAEIIGYKWPFFTHRDKPDGQPRRCLDTSRSKKLLDFQPKTDIMTGLRRTIDWYRDQHD